MTVKEIRKLGRSLSRFLGEFADCYGRCDTRAYLRIYVSGQMSDLQRKSAEPMALRAGIPPRSLQAFLGLNGLLGGGAFLLAPDGHLLQMPFSHLKNTPFSSFLIPGLLLFLFLGVYPIAVAYSLWRRPAWRWPDALNPFKQLHYRHGGRLP